MVLFSEGKQFEIYGNLTWTKITYPIYVSNALASVVAVDSVSNLIIPKEPVEPIREIIKKI